MSEKIEVLQKLNELLDAKITVSGDLIVNYNVAKKELKPDGE